MADGPNWHVYDDGTLLACVPDPTGLTAGVTIRLTAQDVEDLYVASRAAMLGASAGGDL